MSVSIPGMSQDLAASVSPLGLFRWKAVMFCSFSQLAQSFLASSIPLTFIEIGEQFLNMEHNINIIFAS